MESLSVSKFKATCLSVLQDVKKQKKRVIITKRGEPIAEVIISPVAEQDWEVLE